MQSISKQELKGCDHIVLTMGLDKNRATYFYKSRKLLAANNQVKKYEMVKTEKDT